MIVTVPSSSISRKSVNLVAHGPKSTVSFQAFIFLHHQPIQFNLCADNKGITATTFIRLGILLGKGRILFNAAKFKKDYHLLEQADVLRFYEDLTKKLQTMPYGPFHALRMTIGHHDAVRLAREGNECDVPDSVLNSLTKSIATSKTA